MTRKTLSAEVKRLQQQHWQLQQQVELLQRSRRALQLKHALAVKWCEGLDYVNQQLSTHAPQLQVHIGDDVQLVLQQVACTEEWPSLEQLLQPDSSTIAPTTDPLALLRHFMPPTAQLQPEDATAVGHAGLFKHTAMTLAIKLQQLQALPTGQRQPLLQDISTIWHRYWHTQSALVLGGRQDVIEQALGLNLETMQPEPEAAAKHQAAQAAAMLPALGLQEQQEEVITVIYRLHCDIVSIIHAERQQLQQQMTQLEVGLGSSKAHTASSAVACDPDQLGDRPEQLQRQQSLANRLQVLLHKEYWLRAIANIFLFGSLTYEQMSKLSVLSWPFGMRPFCVGVAIMQQRESRDQQLLQCAG